MSNIERLSDGEIADLDSIPHGGHTIEDVVTFARAIESAVHAKLSAPVEVGAWADLTDEDRKRELNKLLNDFAWACDFGDDQSRRMAASKAIHDLFAARPPATPALVPLTDEQIAAIGARFSLMAFDKPEGRREFSRAIEAAHGIGTAKPAQAEGGAA